MIKLYELTGICGMSAHYDELDDQWFMYVLDWTDLFISSHGGIDLEFE